MTSISKDEYIDKLNDIVNECNNIYHNTMKMKSIIVMTSTYNDFGIENDDKDPKFKVGDYVRILKYKSLFAKGCTSNWSKKCFFLIKNVKNTVPWRYLIEDLCREKIVGTICEKELQKTNRIEFIIEK